MIKDLFIRSERGTRIPATVWINEDAEGVLLMAHSFRSDRKEDGRYVKIAQKAYENGLNVIGMDFPGNGESEEAFSSYSLTSCLDDMESCFRYMEKEHPFRKKRMILLGYSMGGRLISLFLERHREFSELVFWAALNRPFREHDLFLEQDLSKLKEGCRDGICDFYDIFEQKHEQMSEGLVDDLMERDALAPLHSFRGRVLIVQGLKDQTIEPENAGQIYEALDQCEDKKIVWIEGADHGFGLWDGRIEDDEMLMEATLSFLGFIESGD